MKRYHSYLWLVFLATFFSGCSDDDSPESAMETNFTSFSIKGYEGKTTIDTEKKNVTVRLADSVTNCNAMTPVFTVSDGAQASINLVVQQSGKETMDFNNLVLYTVSNADYSVKSRWHVTVTNNDYTAAYGMGNVLSYWWSNDGSDPAGFYMEQQHTGSLSEVNCGPACAAMALKWRNPSYSGGVEGARNYAPVSQIDGGTWWYPRDVFNFLYDHGVQDVYYWNFNGASYTGFVSTICNLLEQGCLCIVCLNNGNITEQTNTKKEYRTGRYYSGGSGHFLLIKGYRVVNGLTWFQVHDPWGLDLKYSDGTYYGANRYYLGTEVATSIEWNIWTVVVPPANGQAKVNVSAKRMSKSITVRDIQGHYSLVGGGDDRQSR